MSLCTLYVYKYVRVRTHVRTHIRTHVCLFCLIDCLIDWFAFVHVCMSCHVMSCHVRVYVRTYICMHVYAYLQMHTHASICTLCIVFASVT